MEEKKKYSVKEFEEKLDDGYTRKEINEMYNLNTAEARMVWEHSKLKGKKAAKYKVNIELVDEEPEILEHNE